jgi:AraC-like DNA-binding protein
MLILSNRMGYLTRKPGPALADYVESIWIHSGYCPPHDYERVVPAGVVELFVNLTTDRLSCCNPDNFFQVDSLRGPIVCGPRDGFNVINTRQLRKVMGVQFRPGGAAALLGVPVSALDGRDWELEHFWGRTAAELRERLDEVHAPEQQLDRMESALIGRVQRKHHAHRAVLAALPRFDQADDAIPMSELAAELGLSSRRFIELFSRHVGMTPKAYGRVRRFQRVLRQIDGQSEMDWVRIALEAGYYDQSHFNRDFKRFSGITPGQYARLQGGEMNPIPLSRRSLVWPILNGEGMPAGGSVSQPSVARAA